MFRPTKVGTVRLEESQVLIVVVSQRLLKSNGDVTEIKLDSDLNVRQSCNRRSPAQRLNQVKIEPIKCPVKEECHVFLPKIGILLPQFSWRSANGHIFP